MTFTSFVQASLVVGWQNKHDEGKEGTRIASDPPGNLLRGQCGLKRWPAKPLTEFQNPNQLALRVVAKFAVMQHGRRISPSLGSTELGVGWPVPTTRSSARKTERAASCDPDKPQKLHDTNTFFPHCIHFAHFATPERRKIQDPKSKWLPGARSFELHTVSYTHLTLPTKRIV